ncbi:YEATS-associated helix-containing protein [Pseudomonas syringae]|uniref:YEATS-associated helix-containing protein n=1 Tax=Pseudomonas syringae TaxID=317 RepID=UPI003F7562BA
MNFMLTVVLGTLASTGAIGGLAGHFLYGGNWARTAFKNVLLGICAALMVPLFLNTISSTLLLEILNNKTEFESSKYLILIGFCLIASISAQKFIRLMSANVLKELEEVKEKAEDAQTKAKSALEAAESSMEPEAGPLNAEEKVIFSDLDSTTKLVLSHLLDGPYTMRSATGLAQELRLELQVVNDALSVLEGKSFVRRGINAKQQKRWYLTGSGKKGAMELKRDVY